MNIGNQSYKNALRHSSAIASLPSWRYFSSDNEMLFPFIEHLSCIRQPIYNNDEIGLFSFSFSQWGNWDSKRGGGTEGREGGGVGGERMGKGENLLIVT